MRPPKRFWGHPDDWTDAAWNEFYHELPKTWFGRLKLRLWGRGPRRP